MPSETECERCAQVGGPLVRCTLCGRLKKPHSRDAAPAAGEYCSAWECTGYWTDPQPSTLWPGERWGEVFGHQDWHGEPR